MTRSTARRTRRPLRVVSSDQLAIARGGIIGILSPGSTSGIDVDGSGRIGSGMMSPDGLAPVRT